MMKLMKQGLWMVLVFGSLGLFRVQPLWAADAVMTDPEQRTAALFTRFDTDKSDTINEDEFAKAVIMLFSTLDWNHDDQLEGSELPLGWRPETQQADVDGNKRLSFSECIKFIDDAFKLRDVNADASLTREEVKNYLIKSLAA